jgi:hypothetical protein
MSTAVEEYPMSYHDEPHRGRGARNDGKSHSQPRREEKTISRGNTSSLFVGQPRALYGREAGIPVPGDGRDAATPVLSTGGETE